MPGAALPSSGEAEPVRPGEPRRRRPSCGLSPAAAHCAGFAPSSFAGGRGSRRERGAPPASVRARRGRCCCGLPRRATIGERGADLRRGPPCVAGASEAPVASSARSRRTAMGQWVRRAAAGLRVQRAAAGLRTGPPRHLDTPWAELPRGSSSEMAGRDPRIWGRRSDHLTHGGKMVGPEHQRRAARHGAPVQVAQDPEMSRSPWRPGLHVRD